MDYKPENSALIRTNRFANVKYDVNGAERKSVTTIGYIKHENE